MWLTWLDNIIFCRGAEKGLFVKGQAISCMKGACYNTRKFFFQSECSIFHGITFLSIYFSGFSKCV